MEWLKEYWFKLGILLILLIAVCLLAYYFMAFVPRQAAAQQAAAAAQAAQQALDAENQKTLQASELQICLSAADQDYTTNWSSNCVAEGKPATCTILTLSDANSVGAFRTQEYDNCFKEYPQN